MSSSFFSPLRFSKRKSATGKNNDHDNIHVLQDSPSTFQYSLAGDSSRFDHAEDHLSQHNESVVSRDRSNSLLYVEVEEEEETDNPFGSLEYPKYPWNMYIPTQRSVISSHTNLRQTIPRGIL